MTPDISTGLSAVLGRMKRQYPAHANRISALDDPCVRRLYYMRAAWDKAEPISDGLQGTFQTGNLLEPVIERIVSEVGMASDPPWRIVGSQTPTNDALLKKYQISGSIDGFLQTLADGGWQTQGVCDIKTCSGNIYPQINSYQDLGRYPWTRKYRGQLQLYSFAHDLEDCFILFVNKQNLYEMKLIHFGVDMDYVEGLLQKAETVNLHVEMDVPPDGINDPDACPNCPWYSYCAPPITTGGNLRVVDNAELEVVLDRMGELQEGIDEYKSLEKQRDQMLVKGNDVVCGRWMVTWKQASNKSWRKRIVEMAR